MKAAVAVVVALAVAGCAAESMAPSPIPAGWTVDRQTTDGALASVWGSSAGDVWVAGGQLDRGMVLHRTGQGWQPSAVGNVPFIWWIYGKGPTDVYAAGAKGTLLHYDGAAWHKLPAVTSKTLYGLWAPPQGQAWAVGGDPDGPAGSAVILRGDASGFSPVAVAQNLLPSALFKIYGTPAGDVVAVGTGGAILRLHDGQWARDKGPTDVPTDSPIISLWGGGGERLFAVGGEPAGLVLTYDGQRWQTLGGVRTGLSLFGVFASPSRGAVAVGAGPRIVEIGADSAVREAELDLGTTTTLHSVWGSSDGTVFAVGGTFNADPGRMTGVILERRLP